MNSAVIYMERLGQWGLRIFVRDSLGLGTEDELLSGSQHRQIDAQHPQ